MPAAKKRHPWPAKKSWTPDELNLILASARTMPGQVAGIPADHWWPALVLTLLDTGCPLAAAMATKLPAYNAPKGLLTVGPAIYALHPLTIEALAKLPTSDRERLLPWPLDPGLKFHMLLRQYRGLLWRAGLPHVSANLFDRLRRSAGFKLLDCLNAAIPFTPRPGKPQLPRAADRRRAKERISAGRRHGQKPRLARSDHYETARSLRRFYDEVYRPRRANAPGTAKEYRVAIDHLYGHLGRVPTLDDLSDNALEGLMAALVEQGKSPATANKVAGHLLALWNFAFRRSFVDTKTRTIDRFRLPKRNPSAWTIAELGQILRACALTPGQMRGIPASQWWPALVLVLYETGLRICAVLALRTSHLQARGMLTVPAETQKQKADQSFLLSGETHDLILRTEPAKRELLFPSLHYNGVRLKYRAILRAAGLPSGSKDLFHKLRKTCATHLCDQADEAAAVKQLGHSDPSVTRTFYVDQTQVRRNHEAASLLPRPTWR